MKRLAIVFVLLVTSLLLVTALYAQDQTPEATSPAFAADVATRDLEINLGNEWVTQAQLTYPADGESPFPVVILFHGSGPYDLDATYVENVGEPPVSANFRLIAERFAQQGIAVLRYNKRGVRAFGDYDFAQVGASTLDQLVVDAQVVLTAALEQPEVDAERVYLYGWSEGAWVAANLATNTTDTVAGLILQGTPQGDLSHVLSYQYIDLGLPYLEETIDVNDDGKLSLDEINTIEPGPITLMRGFFLYDRTSTPETPLINSFVDADGDELIDIAAELRPSIEQFISSYSSSVPPIDASFDTTALLNALDIPSLLVHGILDGWVPLSDAETIATTVDTVTLNVYEGLGHALSPVLMPVTDSFTVMDDAPIADMIAWILGQ